MRSRAFHPTVMPRAEWRWNERAGLEAALEANFIHSGPICREFFSFSGEIGQMAESTSTLPQLSPEDVRHHGRTHMFVAAILYADSEACPVQIRNMSPSGALIEGSDLPQGNVPMTLRRGSLEAGVRLVWRAGRRAGIAFCATVRVADWMSRIPDCHQARVDDLVRGIRTAGSPGEPVSNFPGPGQIGSPFEADLRALNEELVRLEQGLAKDAAVIAAHPEVQLLDIAIQRVARMLAGVQRSQARPDPFRQS